MGVVEGEEADRDRDTTRGRAEKKRGAGRARDNQDWRNAGKRKGEKQKGPPLPLPSPQHLPPHPPQARELCTLQGGGAGPGVALLPKEPSASFSPPTSALAPPLPSHVWLARKEGAAPYAQVRRILQKTLLKVRVDVVVAPRVPRQVSVRSLRPTGLQ